MLETRTITLGILIILVVFMLIALYIPWCVAHGLILKKRQSRGKAS